MDTQYKLFLLVLLGSNLVGIRHKCSGRSRTSQRCTAGKMQDLSLCLLCLVRNPCRRRLRDPSKISRWRTSHTQYARLWMRTHQEHTEDSTMCRYFSGETLQGMQCTIWKILSKICTIRSGTSGSWHQIRQLCTTGTTTDPESSQLGMHRTEQH